VSRPRRRGTPPLTRSHTPPLDERASFHEHSDDDAGEEENQEGEDEEEGEEEREEPPPQPLPLANALRRQPSITMPGALFPRSPSIDPNSSQPVARHVHFPTKPTYFDYEVPVAGPSSSPERPPPPPTPIPRRSRAESVGELSGRRGERVAGGGDTVTVSGLSRMEKGKQRATDSVTDAVSSPPTRSTAFAGRNRVDAGDDVRLEPVSADTSSEIRVRGMEKQLSAVREERRAREEWWDTEAETTLIREEKAGYEDKIKRLEEEVRRLREEVRIANPSVSISYFFVLTIFSFFLLPKAGEETSNDPGRLLIFPLHAPTATSTAATTTTR
jgi:hypothetical protein